MQAAPLADPSSMSSQGRTNELALAVAKDDLLGVLLVLHYCTGGEVNGRDSRTGLTPLQTALTTPIRRLNVRQLAIECLLFDGADPRQADRGRPTPSAEPLLKVTRDWETTGRAAALAAYNLRYKMDLTQAEAYMRTYQLDVASLPPPIIEPPSLPPSRNEPNYPPPPPPRSSARPPFDDRPSFDDRLTKVLSTAARPLLTIVLPRVLLIIQLPTRLLVLLSGVIARPNVAVPFSPRRGVDVTSNRDLFWVFVGGLGTTVGERFLFDRLEGRGIEVLGIFLSQTGRDKRFAFVGLRDAAAGHAAIVNLNGLILEGRPLLAKPFRDPRNGGSQPDLDHRDIYVGTKRQAARTAEETRNGITLLHIAPDARPADVEEFLRPVIPPAAIERIDVRKLGVSTMAFVRLRERHFGYEAIMRMDGGVFMGYAVRVNWMALDNRINVQDDSNRTASSRRPSEPDHRGRPRSPSPSHRRLSTASTAKASAQSLDTRSPAKEAPTPSSAAQLDQSLAAAQPAPLPSQSSSLAKTPSASEFTTDAPASPPAVLPAPPVQPPEPAVKPVEPATAPVQSAEPAVIPAEASTASIDHDLSRLRSYGLTEKEIAAAQQLFDPSNEAFDGILNVQARFGRLPPAQAKAALEASKLQPAFPHDQKQQQQYESFLKAQAGESREYFLAFFAQLAQFNRSNDLFSNMARNSLPSTSNSNEQTSAAINGASEGGEAHSVVKVEAPASQEGSAMDVDGTEGVKAAEGDAKMANA
ncbi:hypothetical protein JCM8097_005921 [Rhodosporidiobolus ruineniae]